LVAQVRALVLRRALRRASYGDLAILAALASASIALAVQRGRGAPVLRALRKMAPMALAFGAYVTVCGLALAMGYEDANARPFFFLGGAIFALVLAARAWSAAGSARPFAR